MPKHRPFPYVPMNEVLILLLIVLPPSKDLPLELSEPRINTIEAYARQGRGPISIVLKTTALAVITHSLSHKAVTTP